MGHTKRKRTGAAPESSPPKKRARRVAKQTTIPIIDVHDSDTSEIVALRKGRKPKPATKSESAPSPKKKKRAQPPPVASQDSDSDASDAVSSQRKRIRRKVLQSDSDEEVRDDAPKRLRRVRKSSPMDEESDSLADSPRKGRLRRKSDAEDSGKTPALLELDSDDDPEDLELPVQPTVSRPQRRS
ncbi:hypothetical protein K438DRAFT_1970470 [Mycena galopus ATCC 62051]|nr:hypothetical protein K438DRAFT_1970470 [Mycena galopus ATCC 62051]